MQSYLLFWGGEDPSHTFVVVRSFLDNYLYVADDYNIPTSGEITKVYWNGSYINDERFIDIIQEINAEYKGYLGKINGKWAITTYISSDQRHPNGSPKPYLVGCYSIPEEYTSTLEKYWADK